MTSEGIAALIGAASSWAIEFIPPVKAVVDKLGKWKRAAFVLVFIGVPVGLSALACAGVDLGLGATCPSGLQGYVDAAILGIIAFGASQAQHAVVNKPLHEAG